MGGRKFWMCLLGMIGTMVNVEAGPYLTAIAIAFCGGNAAISVAHARNTSESYDIEERREPVVGFDPAP